GGEGHRGQNKNSRIVCVYDNKFRLIQQFNTQVAAAAFLQVNVSSVKRACDNALLKKASRIKHFFCCYKGSKPIKKNTHYLIIKNKTTMKKHNTGKKRPEHGVKIKQHNCSRTAAKIIYHFKHISGIVFIGTRTQLKDSFPEYKLSSSELCCLCK